MIFGIHAFLRYALSLLWITVVVLTAATASRADVPALGVVDIASEIKNLHPELTYSDALDINASGDVVGRAVIQGQLKPWLWLDGALTMLPVPENRPSGPAVGISNRQNGQVIVIGNLQTDIFDEPGQGWIWVVDHQTGDLLDSRELPLLDGSTRTVANAVSADGIVVGSAWRNLPLANLPCLYDYPSDILSAIDFPAIPVDINDNGQIVGGQYIGDTEGNYTAVGIPTGSTTARLTALNALGSAAGVLGAPYLDGGGRQVNRFARWQSEWDLVIDAGAFGTTTDINNSGDVLGSIGLNSAFRPMLYVESAASLFLLSDLLAEGYDHMNVFSADAMNEAGMIAASVDTGAAILVPLELLPEQTTDIRLTSPRHGTTYYNPKSIVLQAEATSLSGIRSISLSWTDGVSEEILKTQSDNAVRYRWQTRKLEPGTYTVQATVTDLENTVKTDSVVITIAPAGSNIIYLDRLKLRVSKGRGKATGKIFDSTGKPFKGECLVSYEWLLPGGATLTGTEPARNGKVTLTASAPAEGSFRLWITGVEAEGKTFDPSAGTTEITAP